MRGKGARGLLKALNFAFKTVLLVSVFLSQTFLSEIFLYQNSPDARGLNMAKADGGITLVSDVNKPLSSNTPTVVAPTTVHHKGNLIAVFVAAYEQTSALSVTDTQGNTYTGIGTGQVSVSGVVGRWFYTFAKETMANTVTGHVDNTYNTIRVEEFSGVSSSDPIDTYAAGTGTSTPAFSTTNAYDLVLASFHIEGATTLSAGSGYGLTGANGTGIIRPVEYQVTSSTLSNSTATVTTDGTIWGGWAVAFKGAGYAITAPTDGGVVNATSGNFTVTPIANYTGTITITPSGGGLSASNAVTLTFNNSSSPQTFTITPTSAGTVTLTSTNSGALVNPGTLTYDVAAANATTYTVTADYYSGYTYVPRDFVVTPNGYYNGTITITPSGGGLTDPIVLTFSGSGAQTFTITPTSPGIVTLTSTNSSTLANPSDVTYMVNTGVTLISNVYTGIGGSSTDAVTHHAGNLIAVFLAVYNCGGTLSVTDTQGNTYTPVGTQYTLNSPAVTGQWFYTFAKETSSNVVTGHFDSGSYYSIRAMEYSGVDSGDPVDTYVYGTNGAITPNFTTTNAHDLILATYHGEGVTDCTAGDNYTLVGACGNGIVRPVIQRETVATLTNSSAQIINTNGNIYGSWLIAFKAATSGATSYTLTTPSPASGIVNAASGNFTVTPNGAYTGTITITPSGGGLTTPITLTFNNSDLPQTFTITPTSAGTVTLTPTNGGGLTNPSNVTYAAQAVATSYTLTAPSPASGMVNAASGNFTVTPNGLYNGTITITPSGGGLTNPITLTFNNSNTPQTFTITPTSAGTVTLTPTNNGGLTNPSNVTYTANSSDITLVSSTSLGVNGGGNTSVAADAVTHHQGNLIAVFLAAYANAGDLSVTDSQGNTYTGVGTQFTLSAPAPLVTGRWFYTFASTTSSNVVTGHFNGSYYSIRVLEYSGIDTGSPVDTYASGNGSSTPAFTTTSPKDLVLAAFHLEGGTDCTAGNGYSLIGTCGAGVTRPAEQRTTTSVLTNSTAAVTSVGGTVYGNWLVAFRGASYTLTVPSPASGSVNSASGNFTVTPNSPYTGTITITPSGGGLSTPVTLTFSNSNTPQTFTITPTTAGTVTLTPTNNGGLVDPAAVTYSAANPATTYTLTPPSPASGLVNEASDNFTVTPNGPYTGTITITPSGGGLSTPVTLTFNNSSAPQTFTITPTSIGTVTLTATNNGGLANPSVVTYESDVSAGTVATPTFSVAGGTYDHVQTVSISSATESTTIYYTTDGTDPNKSSTLYTGPVIVASSETLRAIAVRNGYSDAVGSATYTITGTGQITFTTTGATFAPIIKVTGTPTILWVFSDGTTSNSVTPSVDFGSSGTRTQILYVSSWSAVTQINLGYDGSDGGSTPSVDNIASLSQQNVSAIAGLNNVAASLTQFAASHNPIVSLDFSNFEAITTIECYGCTSLASITLHDTPLLSRLCLEDANLNNLDLSESPSLADLRGAIQGPGNDNSYNITWGSIGSQIWHICIRDNAGLITSIPYEQMPLLRELFTWHSNLGGSLVTHSTHLTSVQAFGNHYTSANFAGGFSSGSGAINISYNQLTSLDVSNDPGLANLDASHNLLGQAAIDAVLQQLDAAGRSNGTVDLRSNAAAPSVTGNTYVTSLQAKGWTVYTTSYTLTVPSPASGSVNSASGNFTVTPNSPYTGTITITPSGGGLSTPVTLTFSNSNTPQTFTITPTTAGTVTLTPTNNGGLVDPAAVTYSAANPATTYTLTPPSPASGLVNEASDNFTVTPNGIYNGTITITPSGGGLSASNAVTLTFNNSNVPQTFTITPTSAGTVTLTSTNSSTLTNPSDATYSSLSTSKAITAFAFNGLTPAVTGVINEGNHTIALTVPYGTNVTNLVPTINITGASVSPSTGSAHNFTNPSAYTVTAADSSIQAYTVTVTVASASTDATLASLALSSGTLSPSFASGTTSYSVNVANDTSSITVTPTANESHAAITVNAVSVNSGSASGPINLSVGSNTITILVTAQDGTTVQTYTLTVTRASSGSGGGGGTTVAVTKPTITSAQIAKVEGNNVNLSFSVANASQMMLSDSSSFTGASWINYASSYVYAKKDGQTKIYLKFRSSSGGLSQVITLDIPSIGNNAAPVFSPVSGTYPSAISVSMTASEGAVIHYTTDGSAPTASSPVYSSSIAVRQTMTIKAIAIKTGYANSGISSASYTIDAKMPYLDGTLLKISSSARVYVIIDAKKKWISTPEVFEQLGYKWGNIQTITGTELLAIPDYEDNLIRAVGDYKVYLVVNGVKRHIPNPQVFLNYGFAWTDVKDVDASVITKYQNTYLLKESGKDGIYYVNGDGVRKLIPTDNVFKSYGDKYEDVQVVSQTELESYPLSSLIRLGSSNDIYLISGNIKKHIPSAQIFNKYKLNWNLVMSVNQVEFNFYQNGGDLN